MALNLDTKVSTRSGAPAPRLVDVDLCVLGAGVAGVSAAIEAARLGRRVVICDAAPSLGGQAVGSIIGSFCGMFSNGPKPYLVTHGIAAEILAHLEATRSVDYLRGRRNTTIALYDETILSRWIETAVEASGAIVLTGALLSGVVRDGGRLLSASFQTRYGAVEVRAQGFVDASGDAALAWAAGFPCREPAEPVFGTQMTILDGVDEAALAKIDRAELKVRLGQQAAARGLRRHDGFLFARPGRGRCLVNMTHMPTPLDPLEASRMTLDGRDQVDRLVEFLSENYPAAFKDAGVRLYGLPGIRMTRWIKGRHHITADEIRAGTRFPDAVARCSWPIELHNRTDDVHWEEFGDDHMHYVPLGAMIPEGADNLVAAGRCIDGDPAALSSVRVMGPCIATGAAAAHALDLAGSGSVSQIDIKALQARLYDNLERCD
ncbi:MAG: FAD-dependent oxidoreductase [Reyranellales bacterium]